MQEKHPGPRPSGSRAGEQSAGILDRNVRALLEHQIEEERAKTSGERIADRIGQFAGTMTSVYVHLLLVGVWVFANVLPIPFAQFDPSLILLGTVVSVEAIFLATFVLISQNRMSDLAKTRAHLGLQVGLLNEQETTRVLRLLLAMSEHMGMPRTLDPALEELSRDLAPKDVLDQIEVHTGALEREQRDDTPLR